MSSSKRAGPIRLPTPLLLYREFDMSLHFRLAHLIRDVKFLLTLPDVRDRIYGTKLREALRALFGVIQRMELLTAEQFQTQLEAARAKVLRRGTNNMEATNHCCNRDKRIQARRYDCKQARTLPRDAKELKKTVMQAAYKPSSKPFASSKCRLPLTLCSISQ